MDLQSTPFKDSKNMSQTLLTKRSQEHSARSYSKDSNLMRELEHTKMQLRQLEAKNRSLNSQIDQLINERQHNENKLIQKVRFNEENIAQLEKQKNYQIEKLQLKYQEEIHKAKTQTSLKSEELFSQMKKKDYIIQEKDEKIRHLAAGNDEIKKQYDKIYHELMKSQESQTKVNQDMTKVEFENKKLEMIVNELESQKVQMEGQIRVLLDIETEKSKIINELQIKLRNYQQNQRILSEKIIFLNENILQVEQQKTSVKQELNISESQRTEISKQLTNAELTIREKDRLIMELSQQFTLLEKQLEEQNMKMKRREREVIQLIDENQRLYKELTLNKHRLHQIGINHRIQI